MEQIPLPFNSVDCRYYQECEAPMCPKDIDFGKCLWFPGEPVCRLKEVPDWVLKQRKIAKLPAIDPNKYFTLRMLNSIDDISLGLEGIDPEYFGGEKLWLSKQSDSRKKSGAQDSNGNTDHEFELDPGNYPLF